MESNSINLNLLIDAKISSELEYKMLGGKRLTLSVIESKFCIES